MCVGEIVVNKLKARKEFEQVWHELSQELQEEIKAELKEAILKYMD